MEGSTPTYEQIMTMIAENTKLLQLSRQKMEESDRRIAESQAENNRQAEQSNRRYEILKEELAKELAESRKQTEESRKQAEESSKKTADELRESRKSVDSDIKRVSKQIADLGDSLGKFAEEQVRPRLVEMFREKGVYMEEIHGNIVVERNGQYLLEIDLLLVNTIYSVVVEVKHNLKQKDVDEHIERLEKLQLSPSRSIKGTKMYGAVAGMIVNKEVERYAIKKGFYLVKPKGDSVEISNAHHFKAKTWDVAN